MEQYDMQDCYCHDIGIQQLRTVNLIPQTGTTTGTVNLGNLAFYSGRAITYTNPNTINFNAPGLYYVYYAFDTTVTSTGDSVTITPQLAGATIPGSSITVTPTTANTLTPGVREFYVSVNRPATLTFTFTTTAATSTINDFTVTVIRES